MSDFEDRLRTGLRTLADEIEPPAGLRATVAARLAPPGAAPARPVTAPRRRPMTLAAAVVLGLLFLGSVGAVLVTRAGRPTRVATAPDEATTSFPMVTGPGQWLAMVEPPTLARQGMKGVWTGTRLVVWGGFIGDVERLEAPVDGAAYDTEGDLWQRTAPAPVVGRAGHAMVWTGREVVVYGGTTVRPLSGGGYDRAPATDGAAYDPATDSWRVLAAAPAGAPPAGAGVWTGREVLVVGPAAAAAYDPAADSWRTVAAPPVPPPPDQTADATILRWTGREVLMASGAALAAYDPATDRWRALAAPPGTVGAAEWTGRELLAVVSAADGGPAAAAAYDPAADSWRPLAAPPFPSARVSLAWTGDRLLAWGRPVDDRGRTVAATDTWSYDPAADRWAPLPPSPLDHVPGIFVWTGDRLVVWLDTFGDGARYLA